MNDWSFIGFHYNLYLTKCFCTSVNTDPNVHNRVKHIVEMMNLYRYSLHWSFAEFQRLKIVCRGNVEAVVEVCKQCLKQAIFFSTSRLNSNIALLKPLIHFNNLFIHGSLQQSYLNYFFKVINFWLPTS